MNRFRIMLLALGALSAVGNAVLIFNVAESTPLRWLL
jgi:hypothetical protein